MKYLDMPPGNDHCESYDEMMRHVGLGRAVGIVPVAAGKKRSVYILTGKPQGGLSEENSLKRCVQMGVRANHAAMCEGYEVQA